MWGGGFGVRVGVGSEVSGGGWGVRCRVEAGGWGLGSEGVGGWRVKCGVGAGE